MEQEDKYLTICLKQHIELYRKVKKSTTVIGDFNILFGQCYQTGQKKEKLRCLVRINNVKHSVLYIHTVRIL